MNTEVKDILKRSKENSPFVVPEGYFDSLTSRVMANIPENEAKVISIAPAKKTYWKGWVSIAAACMTGAVICVNVLNKDQQRNDSPQLMSNVKASTSETTYDDAYRQEVLNYAMVDYNDVYNYMSGTAY